MPASTWSIYCHFSFPEGQAEAPRKPAAHRYVLRKSSNIHTSIQQWLMQICLHMYTTPKTLLNSLDLQHKAYMIWQLGPINWYHILIWFTYNRDYILICKYKQTHSIDFSSAPENACTEVLTTKSETIPKVSSVYEYSKNILILSAVLSNSPYVADILWYM